MNTQRIIGMVMLIVGIVIFCVGMNASNSVADQMKQTFTGRFTQETALYIFGGLAVGLAGLFMTLFGPGGKNA